MANRAYWTHNNRHKPLASPDVRQKALRHEARQLDRLFTSYDTGWGPRHWYEDLDELVAARVKGELGIRAYWVRPEIIERCSRFDANRLGHRSESSGHLWLKYIGRAWLQDQFNAKVSEEYWFAGHRFDLCAPNGQAVLECGNTHCGGAMAILADPDWRYFLLPYSIAATRWLEEDWNGKQRPRLAIFEILLGAQA